MEAVDRARSLDVDHSNHPGYDKLKTSHLANRYQKATCREEFVSSVMGRTSPAVDIIACDRVGNIALIEIKLCLSGGASLSQLGR